MTHYTIAIKLAPRLSAANKRALDRATKQGLKHNRYAAAAIAAATISELNCVQHVTITHVNETSMGVWRKGKKS